MHNLEARIQSVEDARYFAKRRVPKSLFQLVAAATGPVFFQLYYVGGREAIAPVIERASRAGVDAPVVIADSAASLLVERPYPERVPIPAGVTLRDAIRFAPQLVTKPA